MIDASSKHQDRPDDSSYWPVDLHAHSTASDGSLTPSGLVDLATERGIEVLALTDHDTVRGIAEALQRATEPGITLVPGVELSTTERGAEIHVLGYGADFESDQLRSELASLAASRRRRVEAMIQKLRDEGYRVDAESVMSQADSGSIGRPHLARGLMDIGAAISVDDAFERFLKPGRPGWIPREPFTPEQAVELLVAHGAVPVLAHPLSTGDVAAILKRLIPHGLKGMEVFYGPYSGDQRERLHRIAIEAQLIPTGGSDYHGPHVRPDRELGAAPVPRSSFERLLEAGVKL